jgi:hypothetical protein
MSPQWRTDLTLKQRYEISALFARNISQKETVQKKRFVVAMLCKLELVKVRLGGIPLLIKKCNKKMIIYMMLMLQII